ncbi:hypothetical protein GCK32_008108, partial [Trichostrongylus colubriformis]
AAEVYITCLMDDANVAAIHARRATLMSKDIRLEVLNASQLNLFLWLRYKLLDDTPVLHIR